MPGVGEFDDVDSEGFRDVNQAAELVPADVTDVFNATFFGVQSDTCASETLLP